MKKLFATTSTKDIRNDSDLRLLSKELKEMVRDDSCSIDNFIRDYSEILIAFHNREIRRKLKSINSIMVFFGVIVIIGLLISLFGGL